MQDRAFNTKGSTNVLRKTGGNRSEGDKEEKTKTIQNKKCTLREGGVTTYQTAAPHKAMMKVGDSALWLKITTQRNRLLHRRRRAYGVLRK